MSMLLCPMLSPHHSASSGRFWLLKQSFELDSHMSVMGTPANLRIQQTREDFLKFVDTNSQPNGRSADSTGPTFYFSPKFTTIQTPKQTVAHYEECVARSLVGEFNRVQREFGKGECSNGSSHNWLKTFRPKVSICPHQED